MADSLNELSLACERIETRADFAALAARLAQNATVNLEEWENQTVAQYLEAMSRWADDHHGFIHNMRPGEDPEAITWRVAARLLMAAVVYE